MWEKNEIIVMYVKHDVIMAKYVKICATKYRQLIL